MDYSVSNNVKNPVLESGMSFRVSENPYYSSSTFVSGIMSDPGYVIMFSCICILVFEAFKIKFKPTFATVQW